MGKEKTTSNTDTSQQSFATPEETELNKILLEQTKEFDPVQRQLNQAFGNLALNLGQGKDLPGYLKPLGQGISTEAIGNQASMLAKKYGAGFQNLGIADSGQAYRETSRGIANDLLYPAEQFNIGNLQNLLNLALSGQAQVQATGTAGQSTLASNLQGLRKTEGSSNTTMLGMNPFLKSFQQNAGKTLGSPKFSIGPATFGGK